MKRWVLALVVLLIGAMGASGQEAVSLIEPGEANGGWTFDNGREFPGATGSLSLDKDVKHEGQDSLKLVGDFTRGGNYVQAAKAIDVDIRELSFWVKNLAGDSVGIRIVDAGGRCHQINLKAQASEGWQRIVFPLEQFFTKQATAAALTSVRRYESWGGDKSTNGKWTGPAKLLVIMVGKRTEKLQQTIWINGVSIVPKAAAAAGAPSSITTNVRLDEVIDGEHFWQFHDGREFPGATGSLTAVKDEPEAGQYALKLAGDFTKGGAYVSAAKTLDELAAKDVKAYRLKYKTSDVKTISARLGDGSGQTHQMKGLSLIADGKWHELTIKTGDAAGSEHWGGKNDGKWHEGASYFAIVIGRAGDGPKAISLLFSDVRAEAVVAAKAGAVAYQNGFENGMPDWTSSGNVKELEGDAFKGKKALVLEKAEATLRDAISATSPSFPMAAGKWEVAFAVKTELTSPDSSYNGTLAIEFMDRGGKAVGQTMLAEPFGKTTWRAGSKQLEFPAAAVAGRFVAKINKETPGRFLVDELSASAITTAQRDERIKRLMFTTAQMGNLLFPQDSREVALELWASRPLSESQRAVSCTISDYWGAEQASPLKTQLERKGRKGDMFVYEGKIDLKDLPLEVGRYYEIHARIEREGMEPFTNYSSFAILPEAPANSFKPEEIPFTSRNWDNRLTEYVLLTHRLGIRICGVWGNMSADKSKLSAPQLELIQKLGMGWLTGSPAHAVEQRSPGYEKLTEENLRQAVRNFIEKYGHVRPMIVDLGNEPHSRGDAVKIDIEAYRVIYDEIKKVDPSIFVVGTSVGPSETHFQDGFGKWCDAYDFHVYEDASGVRSTVAQKYPAMFKKYGDAKPIWSTELGLNSQGMARQSVASELYRKFTNFFAAGGANVSWFGLLYPDTEGKNAESFGSAHNVFDCRYNKYAPKLDAIAYYNAVNAIAIKKFLQERVYGQDVHAFLFRDRDNRSLQIWYKDKGRQDINIPLAGVGDVQLIRIDGSRSTLAAEGKAITLTISEDPVVLLYDGGEKALPDQTAAPSISLGAAAPTIVRGGESGFDVALGQTPLERVVVHAPPFWQVRQSPAKDDAGKSVIRYTFAVPEQSTIREADITVLLKGDDGKPAGQIQYRPAVTGMTDVQLLPLASTSELPAAIRLVIRNNSTLKQQVSWDVTLTGEQELKAGAFTPVVPASAYFAKPPTGMVDLDGGKSAEIALPLADADLMKVYRTRATVRDASGRTTVQERPVGAFYGVPKATSLKIDGKLDDADWSKAPVRKLDKADQFYAFPVKEKPMADWKGPDDLSADIRYLWDDRFFYVSVKVTDDIAGQPQQDEQMWYQDGLQFLIDPMRTSERKVGKYDYALGLGKKGLQTWCYLSADGAAPTGEVKDIQVAVEKGAAGRGDIAYEIAIPWSRLAPFKPAAGADLGFTLIINEDDGHGRDSFMTWFGNAHNKDVDTVGDLILMP